MTSRFRPGRTNAYRFASDSLLWAIENGKPDAEVLDHAERALEELRELRAELQERAAAAD